MTSNYHQGPSNPSYWTRDSKPDASGWPSRAIERTPQLPKVDGVVWTQDSFSLDEFQLRSSPEMRIVDWSRLGYWRNKLFPYLLALSVRLPREVQLLAFIGGNGRQVFSFLSVDFGGKNYRVVGTGLSNTQARQDSAQKLIAESSLYDWLDENHSSTLCNGERPPIDQAQTSPGSSSGWGLVFGLGALALGGLALAAAASSSRDYDRDRGDGSRGSAFRP